MSCSCPYDSGTLHRMPDVLPGPDSTAWARLYPRMMDSFVWSNLALRPPLRTSRILIIHPAYTHLEAEAQAIYNDDITPCEDGDGNAIPLPRVWRWEHHFHIFFVMEMPDGINLRALLLKLGDRELDVA